MNRSRKITAAMKIILVIGICTFIQLFGYAEGMAAAPEVVCVPGTAHNPFVPHDTWSGLEITLKGTAHDSDGDANLAIYTWDFGDGSPVETGAVTDPYVIEARHTYSGAIGDMFVARLTVSDTGGESGSDEYLVEIKDSADLSVRVNVTIDEGLWRLHKDQERGILPGGTSYGNWNYPPSEEIILTRGSGDVGDITGAWHLSADEGEYDISFQIDGSFTILGVMDCGGGTSTYNAEGTYQYDQGAGLLMLDVTSSNFDCEGPEEGTSSLKVLSITQTSMTWEPMDDEDWTVSATGAATEAFEIQGTLPNGDPTRDPYVETVQRGLNYLLSRMNSFPVSQDPNFCPLGNPDVNGNGIGLCCYTDYQHSMYESGIALMALASSGCPDCVASAGIAEVAGRSYLDIVQDMVDYFAYAQSDPVTGNFRGGWRYFGNIGESDNSVSQWPVIGMESAEVNFGPAGLQVPQFVKEELNLWIDNIQDDVSGGSGYMYPDNWINIAKTGGLLCEMKFVGDPITTGRVNKAAEYIYANWDIDPEHFPDNSYYAFYSVMKGFRLLGIETIYPINNPSSMDWYGDPSRGYAQYLVGHQDSDGSWPGGLYSGHPLSSAWAILTLKKTVVQPGPVAEAGPNVTCHPPIIELTFNGTGSFHRDPGRNIVRYVWNFGDGSVPVEGAVVRHGFPAVYDPSGAIDWDATTRDYTVTLTVFDDSQSPLSDSDSLLVSITPPPWPPVADADGPYTTELCRPVMLDGSGSYDPNGELYPDPSNPWHGEILSWEWDFNNDGEYHDATGETVNWFNCNPGIYVVGLRVTNNFDVTDDDDTLVIVTEPTLMETVYIDVKPGSCPNPLNLKSRGVLPVALLGGANLDVSAIDPASIKLTREGFEGLGISPLRWSLADVATPYVGELCGCHEIGSDGYQDLTLKFDTPTLVEVLDLDEFVGETITLILTGNLTGENQGMSVEGRDCLLVKKQVKE